MATQDKKLTEDWQAIFTGPGTFEGTDSFAGHFATTAPAADAPYHRFSARDSKYLISGQTLYARRLGTDTHVVFTPDEV